MSDGTDSKGTAGAGPRVSVVVPSYNQSEYLGQALDSILSQDYPAIDVLVMDGGSTDGSVDVLRGYGDRIRWVSNRDRGQSHAINMGFERVDGDIVAWLNSDDLYAEAAVRRAVEALESKPEAGMAYGHGALIDEHGEDLGAFPCNQPFDLRQLMYSLDYIMQPTVFMRADRLRELGYLDESLHYTMDWDLWIRFGKRWPVAYVPELLACTREYDDTKTASGGLPRWREICHVLRRHGASRFAPGIVAYGLDTLRKIWPRLFGPSTIPDSRRIEGSRLAKLCRPIHIFTHSLIRAQMDRHQSLYPDGWLAPRALMMLPWNGEPGVVRVVGELPEAAAAGEVTVSVPQQRTVRRSRPLAGLFQIEVPVSAAATDPEPLEVAIRASSWRFFSDDPRPLSFQLREIQFVRSA